RSLRLGLLAQRQKHLATQPMQFGLEESLVGFFCGFDCLRQQAEANLDLMKAHVSLGELTKLQRAEYLGIHPVGGRDGVAHHLDSIQGSAVAGENGALIEPCPVLEVGNAMVDAMGHKLIGVCCRSLWIVPERCEHRLGVQGLRARYRMPESSCTVYGLFCGS